MIFYYLVNEILTWMLLLSNVMQRIIASHFSFRMKHFVLTISYLTLNCILGNSLFYTNDNSTKMFEAFKEKYIKAYKNINEERSRYKNFVKNLNKVTKLNEVAKDNTTVFVVNQYADLDPEDIEAHYAIHIKPYNKISLNSTIKLIGRNKPREIDFTKMYDLYKANELYEEYKKNHKRNLTQDYDRIVHYYRFVKTLVEINRNQFDEDSVYKIQLDDTADIVKEPNEYFY